MTYKGKVTKDFIDHRNKMVANDSRAESDEWKERQWDFEFPEYHQCSIPSSGHKIYEGYEADTEHDFFGRCDFKHVNRFNEFTISTYIHEAMEKGKIDHIIPWKFAPHPSLWAKTLQEGDVVKYEILDYIPVNEILSGKKQVRGFTIKLK